MNLRVAPFIIYIQLYEEDYTKRVGKVDVYLVFIIVSGRMQHYFVDSPCVNSGTFFVRRGSSLTRSMVLFKLRGVDMHSLHVIVF